ncbi:MAG TPA: ATP-binding protein, partial [Paracoccaceae bacterium]|nr:ATP-binding protein [Paracoccaceae bacterium]
RTVEETDHDLFASDAELRLDLPEDPVWCEGDALSLVEACKNLVNNALRYGAQPVTLAVCGEGAAALIAVRDCGPGLPEAHWADAGVRYARSTGVSPTSAGLGLAIVTAVAKAHEGALRFGRTEAGEFEAALVLATAPEEPP